MPCMPYLLKTGQRRGREDEEEDPKGFVKSGQTPDRERSSKFLHMLDGFPLIYGNVADQMGMRGQAFGSHCTTAHLMFAVNPEPK